MTRYLQVTTTTDSRERAEALATSVVERRLAACAQVIGPITSVYRWEDAVHTEAEWQLVLKTTESRFLELQEHIKDLHTYEVPEIVAVPIHGGLDEYLWWISDQT